MGAGSCRYFVLLAQYAASFDSGGGASSGRFALVFLLVLLAGTCRDIMMVRAGGIVCAAVNLDVTHMVCSWHACVPWPCTGKNRETLDMLGLVGGFFSYQIAALLQGLKTTETDTEVEGEQGDEATDPVENAVDVQRGGDGKEG